MEVVKTARELAALGWGGGGVFVPTMGALHEGHASLVRTARRLARPGQAVVVSIFVNPTQFGPSEDFARYPRTLEADLEVCDPAGASVVFVPEVAEVYPGGAVGEGGVGGVAWLPRVATEPGLEDAARPGHFAGVYQVVRRLFELVHPAQAVFGEKDWQQLQVIRSLVAAERLAIEVVPGATVREADGLALSSRNRFLSPEERRRALALSRGLQKCRQVWNPDEAERILRREMEGAGIVPDYAVVRDAETLALRSAGTWDRDCPMRALAAGRVGPVRLLDNMAWGKEV